MASLTYVGVCVFVYILTWLQVGEQFAQENGMFFIETSAKTAENINALFYEIGEFFFFGTLCKIFKSKYTCKYIPSVSALR